MRKRCAICGKAITEQFQVCMGCLRTYDLAYKYKEWPDWVKALVRIENRFVRTERREESHVSYEEAQDIINDSVV